jgi:hypothetical protein
MTKPKLLIVSAAAASLLTSGCSNLTPGENAAIAGAVTGLAVGLPMALTGVNPAATIPVTAGAAVAAAGATYLVSQHQANKAQVQTAENRARNYAASTQPKTRYIAVRTESSRNSNQRHVLIYDTYSQQVVSNTLYQLSTLPTIGSTANFGGYQATYIGTGL